MAFDVFKKTIVVKYEPDTPRVYLDFERSRIRVPKLKHDRVKYEGAVDW